jgi:Ca2+-transporting ATPase
MPFYPKNENKTIYSGTLVASGLAVYRVNKMAPKLKSENWESSTLSIKEKQPHCKYK